MESMINFCQWDRATWLFFSGNVFDPIIYYSHFAPLIISLLVGVFVLCADRKVLMNRALFSMMLFFSVWVLLDAILWATEYPNIIMFVWSIQIFFDLLIYASAAIFVYAFVTKKNRIPFWLISSLFLAFIPLFFLAPSSENLLYFDFTNCDREAAEGVLWQYVYTIEILIILGIILFLIKSFLSEKDQDTREKLIPLGFGIALFLLAFSFGNLVGSFTEDWSYGQYGLFGMPVFAGFLAYLIIRYRAFNMRLFSAQALVIALSILVGSQLFFVKSTVNFVLTSITFFLAIGFGLMLIRSVRQEIERKEELQTMADRLAVANDQLRKLDSSKSEFISIASHQLRTPLTAIKGFVSLLLEGSYGAVPSTISDVLNKIYTSNERIIQLVENLLSISRIESGKIQYEYAEVNVEDMLSELRDTFMISAKKKNLELVFINPSADLPRTWVDRQKSLEVISNLIDNAIKYTSSGSVTVRAEAVAGAVRVSVSDTGIGMSADTMPYLFVKFSRGKDVGRLHANGTGLGLYVGKQMIEAQGGRIWAESEGEGKGSTFFVDLPVKRNTDESVAQG